MTEKSRYYVVLALLAATSLPFLFLVNKPAGSSFQAWSLYVSAVMGYVGLSLLLWEFVLGTRAVSGLFFKDLATKLSLHRTLGTYGSAVFLLHPVFILLAYKESIWYALIPSLKNGYETAVTYGRLAFFALAIIWVTSAVAKKAIAYRPWKYIHYLSYPILLLALLHIPTVGSSFHNAGIQFFWVVFVLIILLCTALRLRHVFGFGKLPYIIEDHKQLTHEVYMLQLRALGKSLTIQPGQYVYVQPTLLSEEHPFTVLDYHDKNGQLLIAYKTYGSFTKKLASLQKGTTLLLDGPYGNFTYETEGEPAQNAVFLAGGIGSTPFLKHALRSPEQGYYLFYANRTAADAVLHGNFKRLLGDRYINIYSRERHTSPQANTEYGHISHDILQKYLAVPQAHNYYICGPQGFIETAKAELAKLGVTRRQIFAEEFGF